MKYIKEHKENDKILSRMLADEILGARYKKSVKKVCSELKIDYLS